METNASSKRALEKKEPQPEKVATGPMEPALDSLQELRVKVAAIMVRLMLEREQLTPWQNDRHELLWGGHDAFGLWIYRRPDKTLYGMNYDSREKLKAGTIEEHAKRHDYPNDLNACASFERELLANHEQGARYRQILAANSDVRNAKYLSVEAAMCHATAEERSRAYVKLMEGTK